MLRYAIYLSGFNYTIVYRNTKNHANADFLSRFPDALPNHDSVDESTLFQINQLDVMPVTRQDLSEATREDPTLSEIITSITSGTQFARADHSMFSIQDGCLFRGDRVAIPRKYQKVILDELHSAHIGMTKMKALARSYCWWPTIDKDIEQRVRGCLPCCEKQNNPTKTIHPWDYPTTPWQRLHVDYAGPFRNLYFMIVVDAYSKWVEVVPMTTATSHGSITELRNMFARFGLPSTIVTDNGTTFTSREFEKFLTLNGITHKRTAPYHPSSNGQVERYVQVVKKGLKTMSAEPGDINLKLCRLLLQYRRAPQSSTKRSPSELLLGKRIRTKLDMLTERKSNVLETKHPTRTFNVGDWVQFRTFHNRFEKWDYGRIVQTDGYLHYWVDCKGKRERRHVDQIRSTQGNKSPPTNRVEPKRYGWPTSATTSHSRHTSGPQVFGSGSSNSGQGGGTPLNTPDQMEEHEGSPPNPPRHPNEQHEVQPQPTQESAPQQLRRSSRQIKRPKRYCEQ